MKTLNDEARAALCSAERVGLDQIATLRTATGHEFSLRTTDEKRRELLSAVRAGEAVELEIEILAFQQIDGVANRNYTRFKKSILGKLARSFAGVPLLRDHKRNELEARAGTVTASKAVPVDGGRAFAMTATVTAAWAVEALLARNLDRFSIGWDFPGWDALECSHCKCAVFEECAHLPGDKLDSGERIEWIFTEAEGVEVSAVSVPAVTGTKLEQVRSALSAAIGRPLTRASAEESNMHNIAKTLGLSRDADESTIVAAIGALEARASSAESMLKAERESAKEHEAQVSALEARVKELETENLGHSVDALCAEFADRFPIERDAAGAIVESKLEKQIRIVAGRDIEGARAMLAVMPVQGPPTGEPIAEKRGEPAKPGALSAVGQSEYARRQREKMGMSEQDFAKYNPVDGTETAWQRGN